MQLDHAVFSVPRTDSGHHPVSSAEPHHRRLLDREACSINRLSVLDVTEHHTVLETGAPHAPFGIEGHSRSAVPGLDDAAQGPTAAEGVDDHGSGTGAGAPLEPGDRQG